MLVGVLISIMISIVVGVSLIPTIVDSINTAKNTANAPAGLSGLLDVLAYVFVAVRKRIAALMGNCQVKTSRIRGNLSSKEYGNPELNLRSYLIKRVETRWFASLWDDGIVRYSLKGERTKKDSFRCGGLDRRTRLNDIMYAPMGCA